MPVTIGIVGRADERARVINAHGDVGLIAGQGIDRGNLKTLGRSMGHEGEAGQQPQQDWASQNRTRVSGDFLQVFIAGASS